MVIKKIHRRGPDSREATIDGKPVVVEYEPDIDLRDTEQIPLLSDGGAEGFLCREVLPTRATPGKRPPT